MGRAETDRRSCAARIAYAGGMPEVIIELAQGRSLDQKRALVKDITDAVVRNCGVSPDAVRR